MASYQIEDFMTRDMHLSGNRLLVYALVYSFSKKDRQWYGSIGTICERTGAAKRTVIRILEEFTKEGLFIKEGNAKNPHYRTVQKWHSDGAKIAPHQCQNCTDDGAKMAHNNKVYNQTYNKVDRQLTIEEKDVLIREFGSERVAAVLPKFYDHLAKFPEKYRNGLLKAARWWMANEKTFAPAPTPQTTTATPIWERMMKQQMN